MSRSGSNLAKLRKADVELGKGKKVPEICKMPECVTWSHRTDLLSLAEEVPWYEASNGPATEGSGERKRSAKEDDCRAGCRQEDPQGGCQGKRVSLERCRRTMSTVRTHLGAERVSQRRACRVLGQPRNTQRYQTRRANE